MRDSLVFYRSFYESVAELSDDDRLKVYDALFQYALDGEEPSLSGAPLAIFKLMRPQVDANNRKYENGKKGGRPKVNSNQSKTKAKPNNNQIKTKPKPNDNDNDNVNANVNGRVADWIAEIVPEELRPAFLEWSAMRNKIKKPITSRLTVQRAYNSLVRLSRHPTKQIRIVNQSVDRCWAGFYELKDQEPVPRYKEFDNVEPAKAEPMTDEQRANRDKILREITNVF